MRAQNKSQKLTAEESATLMTHVRELQIRLLVTAVVLVGAGVVAYLYYGQILDILRAPLNAPLYYNSVSGSFSFVMKICMVAGIAVSVPLIVYNFIMFVRPAFINVFTRKRVFMMTAGSVAAAAGGAAFGFLFVIPGALHFFSGFQVHGLKEMISADSYLNFVINTLITFILMFQLPIVVSLIDRLKPISPRAMIKGEKWALIGSIIIAFCVPFAMDFTTQILIAAPIFLLYNLSFVVVVFQHSYKRKVEKKAVKVEAKVAYKAAKTAARHQPKRGRTSPVMPVVAATPLAPHPQLAEIFELQAQAKPAVSAKPVHAPAHTAHHEPTHAITAQPKPVSKALVSDFGPVSNRSLQMRQSISMNGIKPPAPAPTPALRTQPTSVIRQAGTVHTPQRPSMNVRRGGLVSDFR